MLARFALFPPQIARISLARMFFNTNRTNSVCDGDMNMNEIGYANFYKLH